MQLNRENEKVLFALKDNLLFCNSVLDIGCGQSSLLQYIPWITESLGVEIWEPYIQESKKYEIHTNYICSDVTKFTPNHNFDAVMCIDVLEHLDKNDGEKLVKDMITWSDKKVIIYVPNGFLPQDESDGNKYQLHLSGWKTKDFTKLGFKVTGYSGLKYFRSKGGDIRVKKGRTRDILEILSASTEIPLRKHPNYAFALLAIYTKDDNK